MAFFLPTFFSRSTVDWSSSFCCRIFEYIVRKLVIGLFSPSLSLLRSGVHFCSPTGKAQSLQNCPLSLRCNIMRLRGGSSRIIRAYGSLGLQTLIWTEAFICFSHPLLGRPINYANFQIPRSETFFSRLTSPHLMILIGSASSNFMPKSCILNTVLFYKV